jgi:hypothetical protein
MEFLINESQLKLILMEQDKSNMSDDMKKLYSFTSDIVEDTKKEYGLNVMMLLTWGCSVGGLVGPLSNYIEKGNFDVTAEQKALILVGVASVIFFNNRKEVSKVIDKIKEEGLYNTFKKILSKGKDLESALSGFLTSINVTVGSLLELVTYSFLIPVIHDLYLIANNSVNLKEASIRIAQHLIASGVVIVSKNTLSHVTKRILTNLKN